MEQRRDFIKKLGILGSSALIGGSALSATDSKRGNKVAGPSIRIAHITDVHMHNKKRPIQFFQQMLRDIHALDRKPDLIINTGDSVLNMNNEPEQKVLEQWNAWNECMQYNSIPMYSCLGNHDVWIDSDKSFSLKRLQMPARFYSFKKGQWKFIMLDSNQMNKYGYEIDHEQWDWLSTVLSECEKDEHVVVCSHVPLMSFASLMYAAQKHGIRKVKNLGKDMHTDALKIKDHFRKCPNIKLALSGHVHYVDSLDYLGIRYVCGGSVCGNWWKGKLDDFPPGYGIVDLYEDGTIDNSIVYYT